jgi:hypothetical protein
MHDTILISGRDSILVAIPFIFMLFLSVFRLDETLARPSAATARHRLARGMNVAGLPILRDPDGQPVGRRRPRTRKSDLSLNSLRISTRREYNFGTGNQVGSPRISEGGWRDLARS